MKAKKIKEIRYSVERRVLNIFFEDGTAIGYAGKPAEEAIQRYVYQNERQVKPEKIKQYDTTTTN